MAMVYLGRASNGQLEACVTASKNTAAIMHNCSLHHAHFTIPVDKVDQLLRKDALSKKRNSEIAQRRKQNKAQTKLPKLLEDSAKIDEFYRLINSQQYLSILSKRIHADYTFVDDFVDRCIRFSKNMNLSKGQRFAPSVVDSMMSDDTLSLQVRKHCGVNNIDDAQRFAELLVNPPLSMKRRGASRIRREKTMSFARLITSRIDDNMDLRNILRSIVFFGGKCCYCSVSLVRKAEDENVRATSEHLTPLSSQASAALSKDDESGSVHGSHRFGNVVLACDACNVARGSMSLTKWIATSLRINDQNRLTVMANIEAFRAFAGYKEFSQEFSQLIDESVVALESVRTEHMRSLGKSNRYGDRTLLWLLTMECVTELNKHPKKYA